MRSKNSLQMQPAYLRRFVARLAICVALSACAPPLVLWAAGAAAVAHPIALALLCAAALVALNLLLVVRPMLRLERSIRDQLSRIQLEDGELHKALLQYPSLESLLHELLAEQGAKVTGRNRVELARQETELYALQSQINPHFLYNTLDSIRGLALLRGVDEIASIAEALANFFQNVVARQGQLITLREEIKNVNSYMEIQQFRFNNRFKYICDIDEHIQRSYMIPNLTLQPIVENGIVHGLENTVGLGELRISCYQTEDRLVITVSDNGVGMDDQTLEQLNLKLCDAEKPAPLDGGRHVGIALANINRRIKLQFGDAYGLYVMSTEHVGTAIEVTLPLCLSERRPEKRDLYA